MLRPQQKIKAAPQPATWWTERRRNLVICLGLTLLVLAVYGQMARGVFGFTHGFWPGEEFQFIGLDDGDYFTTNPYIKQGLTVEGIRWAFFENFSANWHPLTWISLMLDCQIYGVRPGGPHITNMLLHLASVLLLFAIALKMTDRVWPSALVAALWAVHPLHVESVAWVSERKDVLSTFFALGAILAYVSYAQRPRAWCYALVLACYTLSLFSKQMWVTLPCALLLLDYWPLYRLPFQTTPAGKPEFSRPGWRVLLLEKLPLFALTIGFSVMVYFVQKNAGAVSDLDNVPLGERFTNVLFSYWMYVYKTFWPTNLAIMYPYPRGGIPWSTALWCAVPVAAISAVALYGWRRWPWFLVGWLWYLGTLVPVIGFVSIGSHSWADRYAYVPHIGLFLGLVWSGLALLDWLAQHISRRTLVVAGTVVAVTCLLTLTVRANHQVSYWEDTPRLFTHTVAVTENNYGMAVTLASYLAAIDRLEEAKKYYRMALEMDGGRTEAMVHCAVCIMNNRGDEDEAIFLLKKALEIDPNESMALVQLGLLYTNQGKFEEGIKLIRKAPTVSKRPMPLAWVALGIAESRRGDLLKTQEAFNQALRMDPTEPSHLNVLGTFYLQLGQFDKAEGFYRQVLKYSPNDIGARLDLGSLAVHRGNLNEALQLFEDAVRLRPYNADAHNRLAGGLMAVGKVPQAMTEFERAIQLRPDWPPPYNDLAWCLATDESSTVRNGHYAVQLAEKACEFSKREDPAMLDTLAAAYAEAGRWDDALRTADEAKRLAKKLNKEGLIAEIAKREALYLRKQPWRETSRAAAEAIRAKPKQTPTTLPTPAVTATTTAAK